MNNQLHIDQSGGNILLDIEKLVIPFGLLLGLNGFKKLTSSTTKGKKNPAPKSAATRKQRGGSLGNVDVLQQELNVLQNNLNKLIAHYKA